MSPADPAQSVKSEQEVAQHLRQGVRATLATSGRDMPSSEKETRLVDLFRAALADMGRFCRTTAKAPFFFRESERQLYEVDPRPGTEFATLVGYLAGVTVKRGLVGFALDRVRSTVVETAPIIEVHAIAYNSPDGNIIAVNDFGGGMWRRERGKTWEWKPNGTEEILFWTPGGSVEPLSANFGSASEDHVAWLVEQPHFAEPSRRFATRWSATTPS
jgi:hypothetical protein